MERLSRAHENVIAAMCRVEPKGRSHLLEIINDVVSLFFWRAIVSLRGALDVDAMLVGAGEKESLNSLLPFMPRDRVGHDHGVQMAEMRKAVRVVDGRRNVEGWHLVNRESEIGNRLPTLLLNVLGQSGKHAPDFIQRRA